MVAAILLALNLLLHALQCDVHATLGCYVTMVTCLYSLVASDAMSVLIQMHLATWSELYWLLMILNITLRLLLPSFAFRQQLLCTMPVNEDQSK